MNVAIILARGGSKRIPKKNIRQFCGKPIMAWSIEAAQATNLFDHIIVSTDDEEISLIAKQWGAEAPFLRPPYLAGDNVPDRPALNHAIKQVEHLFDMPKYVCSIYAASPFIQSSDICAGYSLIIKKETGFVFTAASFPHPIQRAFKITPTGIEMFQPEHLNTRTQDLDEAYHDAGQFCWGNSESFLTNLPMFSESSHPIILPRYRVHDIDTLEDWERAELMFTALNFKTPDST